MAMPRTPDEVLAEAVSLYRTHGTKAAAARAAGIPENTFRNYITRAAERGLLGFSPVLPGFRVLGATAELDEDGNVKRQFVRQRPEPGPEFEVPKGHVIKGVSAFLDPENRILGQWIKTREGELDPLQIAEVIKAAFADFQPAALPAPRPFSFSRDLLTFIPLADFHLGLYAWRGETGANWDLQLAESEIGGALCNLIERTPPSGLGVILGGGDLIHADNGENRTARSGHNLDVDGRYDKVIEVTSRLMARTVDAALSRHERVLVRILKGNHDEHSSVAIAYFLLGWYRNEPRVTVDVDPSLFWWHRFGKVLLGATHGHTVKIQKMPSIMAHRRAEDWGQTEFRFCHGFHLHHSAKFATEGEGVISEIHQSPAAQDAYHFGSGYLSGRSLQAITYHVETGEESRSRVVVGRRRAA